MDSGRVLAITGMSAGYGGRRIVADIELTLRRGEILGLLGANGSGKSTLLRAITGQIPRAGSVEINHIDLASAPERAKAAFGLAIDGDELPAALSGRQYLDLVASIRECRPTDWPFSDVPARLDLAAWLNRPIAEYSLGTRAKISIAAALLGSPPLLIFDESLNGLDPVAAWEVKRMIADLAATGRHAVIISTHIVESVPNLCTRAVLLADGRIVESWDAENLADSSSAPGQFEARVMLILRARAPRAEAIG